MTGELLLKSIGIAFIIALIWAIIEAEINDFKNKRP